MLAVGAAFCWWAGVMVRTGALGGKAAGVGVAGVCGSSLASADASPCTFCAEEGGGEERTVGRTDRFCHSVSKAAWKITVRF